MAHLLVWLWALLLSAGPCVCSYDEVLKQFQLDPALADGQNDDTETFLRTDLHDGLECIYPTDCKDVQKCGRTNSGVYRVFPYGVGEGFLVSCDMASAGGGWLVIQRRHDGSVDFFRNWANYTAGFGSLVGEFWLGLEKIHLLTSQRNYELLVGLGSYENGTRFARYGLFFVSPRTNKYRLLVNDYSGTAGDSMKRHNGFGFSTYDEENDHYKDDNCARKYHGAWWYSDCYDSNLNGRYYPAEQRTVEGYSGMAWKHWLGYGQSLQITELKIRPLQA